LDEIKGDVINGGLIFLRVYVDWLSCWKIMKRFLD